MSNIIIHRIIKFLVPIFIIFAAYIQLHGEVSPGGAFQAGAVMATFVIVYHLAFDIILFSTKEMIYLAVLGVFIYALVGTISLFAGMNFLDYEYFKYICKEELSDSIGIFCIEIGVFCTVFGGFSSIYFNFIRKFNA